MSLEPRADTGWVHHRPHPVDADTRPVCSASCGLSQKVVANCGGPLIPMPTGAKSLRSGRCARSALRWPATVARRLSPMIGRPARKESSESCGRGDGHDSQSLHCSAGQSGNEAPARANGT